MDLSAYQTTCGSLLHELQIIWDEIGEDDSERDKMLWQLEQECLDLYRGKVDKTRKYKALLLHSLAESEAEISSLFSALGERPSFSRVKGTMTLKEQLSAVKPILEDLRLKKDERMREFNEIQRKIAQIQAKIAGDRDLTSSTKMLVNERDLTLRKLGELKAHLQELQYEKSIRLQKVMSHIQTIHQLSVVMSSDFSEKVNEIHPSLIDNGGEQSKSISNDTLSRLTGLINVLKQEKQQRLGKLQNLGSKLIELWELMDTAPEEQEKFRYVTSFMTYSVDEVSMQGCLAIEVIEKAEVEVERLNILKASKIKELVLRRQNELEEIYRAVHMDVNTDSARQTLISDINSGIIDPLDLLSRMDEKIAEAKEQALSRRDILDRVEKWQQAALEEKWLDDYEKDGNRYSAKRGAHINLKRAEQARILVGKIPSMVESLTSKTKAWETEKGMCFLYNKVPLLGMFEEYMSQRKEREGEKHKYRGEQKRSLEQVAERRKSKMYMR